MLSRTRTFGGFLAVADVLLTVLALFAADVLRHVLPFGFGSPDHLDWLGFREYIAVAAIWAFFLRFAKVYDHRRVMRVVVEARSLIPAVLIATGALFATFFILKVEFLSRILFVYFVAVDIAILINFRWLLHLVLRAHRLSPAIRRQVLIVGAGPVGDRVSRLIIDRPWSGYEVSGFADDDVTKLGTHLNGCPVLGTVDKLPELVARHGPDEVIIALPMRAHTLLRNSVLALERTDVRIRVVPDVFDLMPGRTMAEDTWGIPMISVRAPEIMGFDRVTKRVFDILFGSVSLIVMAPVMAVSALAIWIESGRPVIFAQRRVGENGRLFTMYKFRTMVPNAEPEVEGSRQRGANMYKPANDSRVTRTGRFQRRTSLDELPQLWNVLRGEMSLVGPRPELPWVVDQYESWQRQRLSVLPGMTGWWQVNGRSDLPLVENVEYDLFYIQNYSPLLDISILLRTLWVVARGRGAY